VSKPRRTEDVKAKILPDGHVVLFADQSTWAFTLSPLAALVWEFCDGDNSVEQIVEEIGRIDQNSDKAALSSQVSELVVELSDSGLLLLD
jgi:hypothetical protein